MEVEHANDHINLVVVDDQPLIRSGLVKVLNDVPAVHISAEANGYQDLFAYLRAAELKGQLPDIIILDQSKAGVNSIDVLNELRKYYPSIRVLIISMTLDDRFAVRAIRSGAAGYLTRESAIEELVMAIHEVHNKRRYFTPDLAKKLIDSMDINNSSRPEHEKLSNRELQVLSLIARGKKMKAIAEQLTLSPATIATYRARILEKMKLKSNVELANYAVRNHLVD